MSADDDDLLKTGLLAAQLASEMLVREYRNSQSFRLKADASIVTNADVEAEKIIKAVIQLRYPTHSFVGEESGYTPSTSRFTWVVDPIDGSKNFLRGVPLFAVEIALIRDGFPHIGVSSLPAMGETLWAVRGKGARSPLGDLAVSGVRHLEEAYVSFGNLKHFLRKGYLGHLLDITSLAFQSRGIGDAWSFHLLAQGKIDMFLDASTAFWDIAALTTIVEEAGGIVTDFQGNCITENSSSVIATNRHLHALVLDRFRLRTDR